MPLDFLGHGGEFEIALLGLGWDWTAELSDVVLPAIKPRVFSGELGLGVLGVLLVELWDRPV